ncbi:MAG: hypothetical protein A6F71_09900 [Cycloclasticus sp. symbiont of Poecilosclerida sp. M]|nr:MAG: hypothetical protein A6F71_09900 [Cycloclasticus sp. symbiont of Poecilosclerida sp. M]
MSQTVARNHRYVTGIGNGSRAPIDINISQCCAIRLSVCLLQKTVAMDRILYFGPVLEELLVDISLLVSIGVLLHNISALAANKNGEEMTY